MTGKKTFATLDGTELTWTTPNVWKSGSELRSDAGEVVGRLIKRQAHWWSDPIYEIDATGNRWRFEQKGILKRRVVISSTVTGEMIATFHFNSWEDGGRLEYADGREFLWKKGGFWGGKWVWLDSEQEPLIGFETHGMLRLNASVDLNPDQENAKAPALLVFLGWFLINEYYRRAAAASLIVVSG